MEWIRGDTIGYGTFGTVSLVKQSNCSVPPMAVKSADTYGASFLRKEKQVLDQIGDFPQVIRCFGDDYSTEHGESFYNVFLELASRGSLKDMMKKNGGVFGESDVRRYSREILKGLRYIHAKGFAHLDIKLENLLVVENGDVKIADFGLAKRTGATRVFAYGKSKRTASVPGPTIQALHGISTHVTWHNHLPSHHILPWDPTIPTAIPKSNKGVPTVVHLHGGIHEPQSDGNSNSWFTNGFNDTGPTWTQRTYHYPNHQHPGNLWYHDHALGLTRVNLLAGLIGAYTIADPPTERPLGLPQDQEFDRPLVVFDRSFHKDGSFYMNRTGNNPSIHPQWQPEYFGDAIIVNGKAWPYLRVRRRKYRFRIINASNARFFNFFFFTNGLEFTHVASDSAYLEKPVTSTSFLLGPSEIADVVIDFSKSVHDTAILGNDAAYPYPSGDPVNEGNGKVMKFIINPKSTDTWSRVPDRLVSYPRADVSSALRTRYIVMYEYVSSTGEPTHLLINGRTYESPVTETPKAGSSEVWNVINLTEDNHPLHIHLGVFLVMEQTELVKLEEFKACMEKKNDAVKCDIEKHAGGKRTEVAEHEKGWKNVYKTMPGHVTKIVVRFSYLHTNASYAFDATAEPGYIYHCHILDHEDNAMMRPLKLIK